MSTDQDYDDLHAQPPRWRVWLGAPRLQLVDSANGKRRTLLGSGSGTRWLNVRVEDAKRTQTVRLEVPPGTHAALRMPASGSASHTSVSIKVRLTNWWYLFIGRAQQHLTIQVPTKKPVTEPAPRLCWTRRILPVLPSLPHIAGRLANQHIASVRDIAQQVLVAMRQRLRVPAPPPHFLASIADVPKISIPAHRILLHRPADLFSCPDQ